MNGNMLECTIDGIPVQVQKGTTVLTAAESAGIKIPTLCYIKDLLPDGSCRLCVVEVTGSNGRSKVDTACTLQISDGDVISTKSEKVIASRKMTLDLLLSDHRIHCFSCPGNGDCRLQDYAYEYGVEGTSYPGEMSGGEIDDSNPFFTYDPTLCILCHRCVNTCNKLVGRGAIETLGRGFGSIIGNGEGPWSAGTCESCGNCVQACPTGALTMKRRDNYRAYQVQKRVRTTCPHCGVGCQFDLLVKNNKIVDVEAANGAPNRGLICVKGRNGSFDFVDHPSRLRHPLIKNHETGEFEEATWDEALDLVASKFKELRNTYGGDSLAGFACARSCNEDIYMLQKMVRTAFQSNNTDNCARVCHAPTVTGLATTLGSGAMTNTIYDITRKSDVIMLVGSNPEEAHPVLGMQIRQAVQRGVKLIVVDPRDIGLSRHAQIHLKLRPGTNVAFANGLMNVIIEEGLEDKEFIQTRTENYEAMKELVKEYTPERVAQICHIDAEDLRKAARMYATADTAAIIYCLGVTEHHTGTEGVMSMSNIAMLCGKIGREGCGVNPIRGQNNVQGACDMGASPNQFPGYQNLDRPEIMAKFEKAWGTKLNHKIGTKATDCFAKMKTKEIRGLFIFGEDPTRTDPDTQHVIDCLKCLDFLVVDDLFMTQTARMADVVLPGRSYAEKEGTFTNTERRVQRVRKAVEIEGDTKEDTWIFSEIMRRMGYPQPNLTSAQIMDEIASVTPSFAGISHERLDSEEVNGQGLQWPCTAKDLPGTRIMHVGRFSRGLGLFKAIPYVPSTEQPDEEYPMIMMTGRILYQYNACAMTDKTPQLNEIAGESFIEINTEDAARKGIEDGEVIAVSSRRGTIHSRAHVSGKTSPGECWMPFHFLDGGANWLTVDSLDNLSSTPEYKVCAVRIDKAANAPRPVSVYTQ